MLYPLRLSVYNWRMKRFGLLLDSASDHTWMYHVHVAVVCQSLVEGTKDLHGLSCRRSAGRLSRYATVIDVLARAFRGVNVPTPLEHTGFVRGM